MSDIFTEVSSPLKAATWFEPLHSADFLISFRDSSFIVHIMVGDELARMEPIEGPR